MGLLDKTPADVTGRRLDAFQIEPSRAQTVVIVGDSMAGNGGNDPVANPGNVGKLYPRGYWVWALIFLGNRLRMLANLGVGGETSTQILARIGGVTTLKPSWCWGNAGTNDGVNGISLATTKANLTAMWNALDAAGIRIVWSTIPPRGSYTGSQRADGELLNAWIKQQGRTRANLIVVDAHGTLVFAGSGGGGAYAVGYNSDATHPNTKGAAAWGKRVAEAMLPMLPPTPDPLLSSTEGDAANLLTRGRLSLVTGTNPITAGGWGLVVAGAPTLTYSKVARTDGQPGNWQQMVMDPGNGVSFIATDNATVGASLAIGDVVSARLEYQVSGVDTGASTGNRYLYLNLAAYNGASFTDLGTCLVFQTPDTCPTFDHSGVLWTPPVAVPSGSTLVQLQLKAAGGQTVRFDRATILNHTTLGLPTSIAA